MIKLLLRISRAAVMVIAMTAVSFTALAASPRATAKKLVDQAVRIMQQENAGEADQQFSLQFDMPLFSQRCLIDHWDTLSDDQKNTFMDVFSGNLRKKLNSIIDNRLRGKKFTYLIGSPRQDNGIIVVPMNVRVNDTKLRFVYFFVRKANNYRLVDYEVQGALLSRNYRGHFNYMIRKYGFDGLIERMREKLASR